MNINNIKTALLMSAIVLLFGFIGNLIGGQQGMLLALIFGGAMNIFAWWNSDKMVLRLYHAQVADPKSAPTLYRVVAALVDRNKIPMPKIYIIEEDQPNAFATGRNPSHASVAATTGLLKILDENELRGVMAHELAHVMHRDTLISTICATVAGAISMLANFALFFGGGRQNNERGHNPFIGLLIALLAPLAAALIQMAISRSREFFADQEGAKISADPLALARALAKIDHYAKNIALPAATLHPETAQMMIINPLSGNTGITNWFRTHPLTEERIARLEAMANE